MELKWRKSSRSLENNDNCVELAGAPGAVLVRDSKNPGVGRLDLSPGGFASLVARVKRAELDL